MVLGLTLRVCASAGQVPFDLDPGFIPALPPPAPDVRDVLPLPDGSLLVSNSTSSGLDPYQARTRRLHADGSIVQWAPDILGYYDFHPWNDSLVYIRGGYYGTWLKRFRIADGSIDSSFNLNPEPDDNNEVEDIGDIVVDEDGSLMLTGWIQLQDSIHDWLGEFDVAWITPEGALDTTLRPRKANGYLSDVFPMQDGSTILSGSTSLYDGHAVNAVFRIDDAGDLDSAFHFAHDYLGAGPRHIIETNDGKYLVGGRLFNVINLLDIDTMQLVRWNHDGSLDSTFNNWNNFHQIAYSGQYSTVNGIHPLDDGRLLVTGNFDEVNGQARRGVAVMSADGELLPSPFGYGGVIHEDRCWVQACPVPSGGVFLYGTFDGYSDSQGDHVQRNLVKLYDASVVVDGPSNEPGVLLYPDPVTDPSVLRVIGTRPFEHGSVRVTDMLGRTVFGIDGISGAGPLDLKLPLLSPGNYALVIQTPKGIVANERFMVQ